MSLDTGATTGGGGGVKGTEASPRTREKNESKSKNEKLTNEN